MEPDKVIKMLNMVQSANGTNMVAIECIKELQAENAELKARLEKAVELPCKVGDIVYEIFLGNIEKITVSGFAGGEAVELIYTVFEYNGNGYNKTFDVEEIGNTIFLTEAEAQAKLDEMKGGAV